MGRYIRKYIESLLEIKIGIINVTREGKFRI